MGWAATLVELCSQPTRTQKSMILFSWGYYNDKTLNLGLARIVVRVVRDFDRSEKSVEL